MNAEHTAPALEQHAKIREVLTQLSYASLELAHGCTHANEVGAQDEDLALLVAALGEMHQQAKNLLASMPTAHRFQHLLDAPASTIDPELDHDGDTQPNNEAPAGCDHTSMVETCRSCQDAELR